MIKGHAYPGRFVKGSDLPGIMFVDGTSIELRVFDLTTKAVVDTGEFSLSVETPYFNFA